jgi:hypothetical protein
MVLGVVAFVLFIAVVKCCTEMARLSDELEKARNTSNN